MTLRGPSNRWGLLVFHCLNVGPCEQSICEVIYAMILVGLLLILQSSLSLKDHQSAGLLASTMACCLMLLYHKVLSPSPKLLRVAIFSTLIVATLTFLFMFLAMGVIADSGATGTELLSYLVAIPTLASVIILVFASLGVDTPFRAAGVGLGLTSGLLIGRSFTIILPERLYANESSVVMWLVFPLLMGAFIGLDIASYLTYTRRIHHRSIYGILAFLIAAGVIYRFTDTVNGSYRTYSVEEAKTARNMRVLSVKLADPDLQIRLAAATNVTNRHAMPYLIKALDDENTEVRMAATSSMGYTDSGEAMDGLRIAAENDSPEVRRMAVYGLASTLNPRAQSDMCHALGDGDPSVVQAALSGIGEIGGRSTIPCVRKIASNPDHPARDQAAKVLFSLGDRSVVRAIAAELIKQLGSTDTETARSAAGKLGDLGDELAVPALERAAEQDPRQVVSEAADIALSDIRSRLEQRSAGD